MDKRLSRPPPRTLGQGIAAVRRVVSPTPVNDDFPTNMLRIIILPYLACRNKSHRSFKTTTPIMTDMHHPDHISYPTFELLFLRENTQGDSYPDHDTTTSLVEELLQQQWGPLAERPVCLYADRA